MRRLFTFFITTVQKVLVFLDSEYISSRHLYVCLTKQSIALRIRSHTSVREILILEAMSKFRGAISKYLQTLSMYGIGLNWLQYRSSLQKRIPGEHREN